MCYHFKKLSERNISLLPNRHSAIAVYGVWLHMWSGWCLLGSYICFTTTLLNYSWYIYCWYYCTTCRYQTTATTGWLCDSTQLTRFPLHCTVQSLKYAPVTSIIGWQFWEPDWVSVTFYGASSLMYPTAWTGSIFWDRSIAQSVARVSCHMLRGSSPLDHGLKPRQCLYKAVKKSEVSHQRWIWGIYSMQATKHASKGIHPGFES